MTPKVTVMDDMLSAYFNHELNKVTKNVAEEVVDATTTAAKKGFQPFFEARKFEPFSSPTANTERTGTHAEAYAALGVPDFTQAAAKQKQANATAQANAAKQSAKKEKPALRIVADQDPTNNTVPYVPNSPAANINLNPRSGKVQENSPVAATVEVPRIDVIAGRTGKDLGVKVSPTNHADETVRMNMDVEGMRVNDDGTFNIEDIRARQQRVIDAMREVGGDAKAEKLEKAIAMGYKNKSGENPFKINSSSGGAVPDNGTIMSRVINEGGTHNLTSDEKLYFNLTRAFAEEAGVKIGDNPAEILQKVTPILSKGDGGSTIDFAQVGDKITLTHTPPNRSGKGENATVTKAANPVSSDKAGYEGIGATGGGSGADLLATFGASAALGAAVTTISEGELSASGVARGAMFGIGGGMALRGIGASLGTGTLNAIGRASGNRLSQMENEFASDAGKQIVKGLDAMSSSASAQTQAARIATLAGAGLTGFAMSRDRNHSRGLNSTRGSRF